MGSEAEIRIPEAGESDAELRESGRVVWTNGKFQGGVEGIVNAGMADGNIFVNVGSGSYAFELTPPR